MPDPIEPEAAAAPAAEPKVHFAKAIDEAMAGAQMLGRQAQDHADAYRGKLGDAASQLGATVKAHGDDARERAYQIANDGKTRTSVAISDFGKLVEQNATFVDERLGVRYGDYIRTTARTLQDTADRLEATDLTAMAEEMRTLIRGNPVVSIGLAAFGGFFFSRLFRGTDD